jgi:hypothetical protein
LAVRAASVKRARPSRLTFCGIGGRRAAALAMTGKDDAMSDETKFFAALRSDGPAADRADKMGLYAWLIGDWIFDATIHKDDGTTHKGEGEIHFIWALDGRAIQDVWILPGFFYGTTLRVYDPALDAWHILWNDPLKQYYTRQLGRAQGRDIVQDGKTADGTPVRWTFTDVTPDSFRWRGERSLDGGASWQLQFEFIARRAPK